MFLYAEDVILRPLVVHQLRSGLKSLRSFITSDGALLLRSSMSPSGVLCLSGFQTRGHHEGAQANPL